MKPIKVRFAECPSCGENIKVKGEDSAENTERDGFQCGECRAIYEDREEAKECCK